MGEPQPCTKEERDFIWEQLRRYNTGFMAQNSTQNLSYCIKEDGRIVAGIVAERIGQMIEVEFLWVDEQYRQQGVGTQLLQYAENEGKRQGAKVSLVNTFGFQAPEFYPKRGYMLYYIIENCLEDKARYYYEKKL